MISNKACNFTQTSLSFISIMSRIQQVSLLAASSSFLFALRVPLQNLWSLYPLDVIWFWWLPLVFLPNCTTISASQGLWQEVLRKGGLSDIPSLYCQVHHAVAPIEHELPSEVRSPVPQKPKIWTASENCDPVISTRQLSSSQSLTSSRLWQTQIQEHLIPSNISTSHPELRKNPPY